MADNFDAVRSKALEGYMKRLSDAEREKLTAVGSIDGLLQRVEVLRDEYCSTRTARHLERLTPLLHWLSSFNRCVQSFIQVSPPEFVLLWGSLSFVIEILCRHSRILEHFVEITEIIYSVLPRFEIYSTRLLRGTNGLLANTLAKFHIELSEFFLDSAKFFNKKAFRNILRTSVTPLKQKAEQRLVRLRDLTYTIDQEARLTGELILNARQDSHHQEIVNLLTPSIYCPQSSKMFFGKSQLALEFAYRHIDAYDAVLWVAAETPMKLAESFGAIAHGLGLVDGSMQHPEHQKEAVMRWFTTTSKRNPSGPAIRWLVIFDNAPSDPRLLESYWPQAAKGSIIVTCRSPEIANRFAVDRVGRIHVEPFDTKAATQFLLSLIDKECDPSHEEMMLALKISKSVGNHPLALDMIGCHIRRYGKSLVSFVHDHPTIERDFLFRSDLKVWTENAYQSFVDDALAMNLGTAVTGHDGIPLSLFTDNSRENMLCDGPDRMDEICELEQILDSPLNDQRCLDNSIEALLGLALITVDTNVSLLKCHRLIRIAVETSLTPGVLSLAFNRLVFFLNASFPMQSDGRPLHAQWKQCEEYAGSVRSTLKSYELHKSELTAPILLCEVVCRCSWYYFEKGQFAIAEKMADRAISLCEEALKCGEHPGYSEWFVRDMISHHINTKASIAREQPSADYGLELSQEVCRIRQENRREDVADDDTWIAAANGNLAVSLIAVGRYQAALEILHTMLDRPDLRSNDDIYMSNACLCYLSMGLIDEALTFSGYAADAVRRLRGDDSAQMAVVLYYISSIHEIRGDLSESVVALKRCLSIRSRLMPRHLYTGFTLHRMGVLVERHTEMGEALELFKGALHVLSNCECHPGAVSRTSLAISQALRRRGDQKGATEYLIVAEQYRSKITDVDTSDYGVGPERYDRFVKVGLR
ncbi:Fc.00g049850.m01.CDS01 [Cosmosporella sp. VM-42]